MDKDSINIEYYKEKQMNFVEFQETDDYKDLLENIKIDFPHVPLTSIIFSIYSWYQEEVLEEELKPVEKDSKIEPVQLGINCYNPEEYSEKYQYIIDQDRERELKQEQEAKEKEESNVQVI